MNAISLKDKITVYITTLYLVLSFYCFGALIIENDVNYPTWRFISDADFPVYHQQLESYLNIFFKLSLTLYLFISILFLWRRPSRLKRSTVIIALLLYVYILALSLLMEVPIHETLNHQKSRELVNSLILVHRVYRLPAEILLFFCNTYILYSVVSFSIVPQYKKIFRK